MAETMQKNDGQAHPAGVAWVERLIAHDTTSRLSNLGLIEEVRGYLEGLGIATRLIHDAGGAKANLFATIGPEGVPGVMLSGHTDVVPVEDQPWTRAPFTAAIADGRLFGRGSCDMKGFLGMVLGRVPEMLAAPLRQPLHLVFSYDEEVGCLGVRSLVAALGASLPKPALCIVGEPTEMKVVVGHKGKLSMRCHVDGLEAHSSLAHRGVNAVETAAALITRLGAIGRRLRCEGPFDPEMDPPYTTVHTGVIAGGTALNIIPGHCRFEYEFRALPATDPAVLQQELEAFAASDLLPGMQAVPGAAGRVGIRFEEIAAFPGLDTAESAPVTQLARALSGANRTAKVPFGTEAGLFHAAGIPTVVCGPGSIDQAHKPDEFVSLDQLAACDDFLMRLIGRLSTGPVG